MGNVWSSDNLMERLDLPRNGPLDLRRSVGAGIRFFMPMIGMLGLILDMDMIELINMVKNNQLGRQPLPLVSNFKI